MPVPVGEGKRVNRKQKLTEAWTGRSEPEAIILCFETLESFMLHQDLTPRGSPMAQNMLC